MVSQGARRRATRRSNLATGRRATMLRGRGSFYIHLARALDTPASLDLGSGGDSWFGIRGPTVGQRWANSGLTPNLLGQHLVSNTRSAVPTLGAMDQVPF